MLFSLPELAERYVHKAPTIFSSAPSNPADDLPSQLAKVGVGLVQGKTGKPPPLPAAPAGTAGVTAAAAASAAPGSGPEPMDTSGDAAVAAADAAAGAPLDAAHAGGGQAETAAQEANSVRPVSFKALVGKGHSEFSSGRQQVRVLRCLDGFRAYRPDVSAGSRQLPTCAD